MIMLLILVLKINGALGIGIGGATKKLDEIIDHDSYYDRRSSSVYDISIISFLRTA